MHTQEKSTPQPPALPTKPTTQGVQQHTRSDSKIILTIVLVVVGVFGFGAIALFGIICAVAVPNIEAINQEAIEAKNRRNAQNLSSICAAATAAGVDFSNPQKDIKQTIDAIVTGKTVEEPGVFEGSFFGMPNLSEEDKLAAAKYLKYHNEVLVFVAEEGAEYTPPFQNHNQLIAKEKSVEEYGLELEEQLKKLQKAIEEAEAAHKVSLEQ